MTATTATAEKTVMLWARPSNAKTADALPLSDRKPDVNITVLVSEYRQHRASEDDEWTTVTDQQSGLRVQVRRAPCGAGCRCAMAVRLA